MALQIKIPEGIDFSELKLTRNSDGQVSFDWTPINAICAASGINPTFFTDSDEDKVAGFIINWYHAHLANGGERDAVADDLILEARLEDEHGGGFSMPPGRA